MKVAIYGDSHTAGYISKSINPELAWPEMLSQEFDVTNFGLGGSSLFYSYEKFCSTHENFDYVIFFATFPGRLYIEHENKNLNHIPGINQLAIMQRMAHWSANDRKVIDAAIDYYTYIYNKTQAEVIHNLMIDDIEKKRPRVCIFDLRIYYNGQEDFEELQDKLFWSKYQDLRQCHFTEEKNIALASMFKNNITTNVNNIDYDLIRNTKTSKKFEDYFVPV